jgi:heptaprenyl diphosphate synthase
VITVSDINRKTADMLDKINQFIHHSYLKKFLNTPQVDEDKLFLLVAMCDDLKLSQETLNSYIITTILVQVALDTHEQVSVATNMTDKEQKVQQLKVLAGDFYSGLYYKLLAEIDDIQMIKVLAEGIKLINEHKIRVYRQDLTYQNSLIDSIKIIESELYRNIACSHQLSFWEGIIPEILLLKRLYIEKVKLENDGYSIISSYLLKEMYEKSSIQGISNRELEKRVHSTLEQTIILSSKRIQMLLEPAEVVHSSIHSRLQSMVKRFEHQTALIVEEG